MENERKQTLQNNNEQRTEKWHNDRTGKFTASRCHELTSNGREKYSVGETFNTYCQDVAFERVLGRDLTDFQTFDMKRGVELEPVAFEHLKTLIFEKYFKEIKTCNFYPIGENCGSSPDGICEELNAVIEIKCPTYSTFKKVVANDYIDPKYYAQMQMQMLATGMEKAFYYNFVIFNDEPIGYLIEVAEDLEFQKKIKDRLVLAESVVINMVKEIEAKFNK